MTDLVQFTKDNGIAVITINNPPVNALSPGVPEGISEALDQIAQDDTVKAVVLIGGGRTFVAGAARAVEMCTSGNPVKAEEALKFGIVDRLIEDDLLAGAVAFAREVAGKCAPKTRERDEKLGNVADNVQIFSSARETAAKKQCGLLAPVAAISAVEAATKMPFEEGCKVEQKLFMDCLFSQQSKSLIHVFFSEREVNKIPDIPKETPIIHVRSAA